MYINVSKVGFVDFMKDETNSDLSALALGIIYDYYEQIGENKIECPNDINIEFSEYNVEDFYNDYHEEYEDEISTTDPKQFVKEYINEGYDRPCIIGYDLDQDTIVISG